MAFKINDFTSALAGGGARNTLFEISMTIPIASATGSNKLPLLAKAASLPASTLGTIQPAYFGRRIKLAGDRSFIPWNVTIINDEDFAIRTDLERWSTEINRYEGNIRSYNEGSAAQGGYKVDAFVTQYGKKGNILRRYKFVGLWPQEISSIDLNWEAQDQIQEFNVVFEYDYFHIEGTNGGAVNK